MAKPSAQELKVRRLRRKTREKASDLADLVYGEYGGMGGDYDELVRDAQGHQVQIQKAIDALDIARSELSAAESAHV